MPAAESFARLWKIAPPWMKPSTRYLSRLAPAEFDQMHEGQLVGQRELLRAQQLLAPHVLDRAGVDAAVARDHEAAHARHVADARDHAAAGHRFVEVRRVEAVAGDRAELQPRRADVEEPRHALARQQLSAPVEQRLRRGGLVARARLERAQLADQRQHLRAIAPEGLAAHVDFGLDGGHRLLQHLRLRRQMKSVERLRSRPARG